MDYEELATKFLQSMHKLHKTRPQKTISEAMQGELFVLQYLYMQEDHVVPGEISDIMGISSARTAAALNSMEQKGLVTREIDKNDRRRILVRITAQGRDIAREHHKRVVENTAKMLRMLGDADASEYIRIMSRLAGVCEHMMQSDV